MNIAKNHPEPTVWLKNNLPALPKNRRWMIKAYPEGRNCFRLEIAIERKVFFWWEMDFYRPRKPDFEDLKTTMQLVEDESVHDPVILNRIVRNAQWVKDLKYPTLMPVPQEFEQIVGTY